MEVAFNQCYRGVPADEVVPRIRDMKAKIDSAGIKVWSIHLPFSRMLDISVLDEKQRKEKRVHWYCDNRNSADHHSSCRSACIKIHHNDQALFHG